MNKHINQSAETNKNYLPEPCTDGCVDTIKGSCVLYKGIPISNPILIKTGDNYDKIITNLMTYLSSVIFPEDQFEILQAQIDDIILDLENYYTKAEIDAMLAGVSGVNIYNANGTLTGERTVEGDGYGITFNTKSFVTTNESYSIVFDPAGLNIYDQDQPEKSFGFIQQGFYSYNNTNKYLLQNNTGIVIKNDDQSVNVQNTVKLTSVNSEVNVTPTAIELSSPNYVSIKTNNFKSQLKTTELTQDRSHDLPNDNGTIALEEWVEDKGYLDTIPNLNQVTTAGNLTTNNIVLRRDAPDHGRLTISDHTSYPLTAGTMSTTLHPAAFVNWIGATGCLIFKSSYNYADPADFNNIVLLVRIMGSAGDKTYCEFVIDSYTNSISNVYIDNKGILKNLPIRIMSDDTGKWCCVVGTNSTFWSNRRVMVTELVTRKAEEDITISVSVDSDATLTFRSNPTIIYRNVAEGGRYTGATISGISGADVITPLAYLYDVAPNIVNGTVVLSITPSSGSTYITFDITKPVSSDFTDPLDCMGIVDGSLFMSKLRAEPSSDTIRVEFQHDNVAGFEITLDFKYIIK